MSTEHNKRIGPQFFLEQDRLRGGPADALCAPAYTAYLSGMPPMNLEAHKAFAQAFYAAFPDLSHTIEDVVAEGDGVAVRFRLVGTHAGAFMGIPATGKSIRVSAIGLMRISEEKIVEMHGVFDQLGMLQQLGVIPAGPAEPEAVG